LERSLIVSLVMAGSAALWIASCSSAPESARGRAAGSERGPCYGNGTCDAGLVCRSERCVAPASAGGNAGTTGAGASHTGATGGIDGTSGSGEAAAAGEGSSGGTKTTGGTPAAGGSSASQPSGGAADAGAGGEPDPGSVVDAPSCVGLAASCGPAGNENCCSSLLVPGGTFFRGYDGLDNSMKTAPAQVSAFRLDKYEITVGRFRPFIAAWLAGWRPATGAGKHAHLNTGKGLTTTAGGYEPGWNQTWASSFPTTGTAWDSSLSCGAVRYTWTSAPGANENVPVNCITWAEADAFCIWDGGFLPSEAEWSYAAAGGDEQRVFPWSDPPSSTLIDCAYANHSEDRGYCVQPATGAANAVGSESPMGDGKYGQADLAGNIWEWTLDSNAYSYVSPCIDCMENMDTYMRVAKGGSFTTPVPLLRNTFRGSPDRAERGVSFGSRCARAPE
jgi:formylglycine-generating enzyme